MLCMSYEIIVLSSRSNEFGYCILCDNKRDVFVKMLCTAHSRITIKSTTTGHEAAVESNH